MRRATLSAMLMPHELDPSLDALVAAADFHRILFENDHVRVLEVVIDPGTREPFHTHAWQSVFIVTSAPHLRYFVPHVAAALFEIPSQPDAGVLHLAPEGLHSLENVDRRRLYAFRIEMKQAPAVPERPGAHGPQLEAGTRGKDLCLDNDLVRVCLAANLHAFDPVLPALLLHDPVGDVRTEWLTSPEHLNRAGGDDVILAFKYLAS